MSRHRGAPVRPRYGRMAALGSSLAVTLVAVLGGTGVLPAPTGGNGGQPAVAASVADTTGAPEPGVDPTPSSSARTSVDSSIDSPTDSSTDPTLDVALPAGTGTAKRVVFSQSRQRVWLVSRAKHVERTYLVSGSLTDNLDPGTYSVYSRSEQAWGIDDSGTMRWFVRFTQGDTGAAIGFHDIPIDDGKPVQTRAQLGTPQSHGCIRQQESDAKALWAFAPIGTTVVVVA
ncbi:L,D-transpeptidase [Nocardioides sp. URHA0032]|uniref:L,D-transpeptidase n=1 Tax=Nocardioides sp. URHA0032 TaxID=1380388 RepID=UPI000688FE90|nr:L,D-transpeptidase [Nocardioides sp. URHA0032]